MSDKKEKTHEQQVHDLKIKIAGYETIIKPYAVELMKLKTKLRELEGPLKSGDRVEITSFIHDMYETGRVNFVSGGENVHIQVKYDDYSLASYNQNDLNTRINKL